MNELLRKSAAEQSKALKNKEISAVELTNAAFERIDTIEEKIGAFNSLTKDTALETAKKVDEKIAKGEELPLLAGIPLALKDNMNLVGSRTTASSKILENFVSPFQAGPCHTFDGYHGDGVFITHLYGLLYVQGLALGGQAWQGRHYS